MLRKLKTLIVSQLTQGVNPRGLAASCALGCVCGIFPLIGATTILCLVFGTIFKLNQPVIQAFNGLMTPIQLLTIPIFLRFGEWIVGATPVTLHPSQLVAEFAADWRLFLTNYGLAGAQAVLAWALSAPILGSAIYFTSNSFFEKLSRVPPERFS